MEQSIRSLFQLALEVASARRCARLMQSEFGALLTPGPCLRADGSWELVRVSTYHQSSMALCRHSSGLVATMVLRHDGVRRPLLTVLPPKGVRLTVESQRKAAYPSFSAIA